MSSSKYVASLGLSNANRLSRRKAVVLFVALGTGSHASPGQGTVPAGQLAATAAMRTAIHIDAVRVEAPVARGLSTKKPPRRTCVGRGPTLVRQRPPPHFVTD